MLSSGAPGSFQARRIALQKYREDILDWILHFHCVDLQKIMLRIHAVDLSDKGHGLPLQMGSSRELASDNILLRRIYPFGNTQGSRPSEIPKTFAPSQQREEVCLTFDVMCLATHCPRLATAMLHDFATFELECSHVVKCVMRALDKSYHAADGKCPVTEDGMDVRVRLENLPSACSPPSVISLASSPRSNTSKFFNFSGIIGKCVYKSDSAVLT
eukprot:8387_1